MKLFLAVFSIIIAIICGSLAVRYHKQAQAAQGVLDEERYNKMVAEEELQKATSKIGTLEGEVSRLEKKYSANEALLEQTKAINKDLRARLDKAAEFKDTLERKIQELEQLSIGN